jgi:DNA polymerase III alpha subunit
MMQLYQNKMYVEDEDIIELMLENRQAKILPKSHNSFNQFKDLCRSYNMNVPFQLDKEFDELQWNFPNEYKNINVREFILQNHNLSQEQLTRVDSELVEFEKRNLSELLRFLIYFVKIIRDNNIIYGVGRGSSIASYVLYLIGVHRIDSLKYNLDIKEFLK